MFAICPKTPYLDIFQLFILHISCLCVKMQTIVKYCALRYISNADLESKGGTFMENSAKIITVAGKGGVGKTSICACIVRLLTEQYPDKKILAIDADPAVLETMMDRYEGVVIAGAGNGSSSTLWSNVVKDRVDGGDETIVVRTGRMDNGIVTDNANYMQSIAANNLNPQKARILLALALTQTKDREQIRQYFAEY